MGRRRTGASLPAWRSDDAAITRQLRSDSEALRYAEWWVRRRLYGLSDQEARWLHAQYVASYRVMQAALAEALADERGPLTARRARLLGQIEAEMDRLTREVGAHLLDTSVQAYQQGAAGRAWALDMATNPDVGIHTALLPTEAIRAAILTPYLGQQWGDTLALERDEFVLRIKRSLTASLVQGEGMAQAQRRLRDELGIQTDRRKGFKRNFYRTLLIARTEIMRASNLGALAVYEQNQDVLSGWEWVATRDERTCFPAWVQVETDSGPRPIAQLKPGDRVLTRKGYRAVRGVMRKRYAGRMVRVVAGDRQVVATADHLFWSNGWRAAGTLTIKDTVQTFGNQPIKVRGVFDVALSDADHAPTAISRVATHYKKWLWVYDIEVEGEHEFYAEGVLVHNCPTCGALDGKRYAFGDPVLAPPSGSHPGCRCTAVPVLRDTDLMDRVAGVRETYAEWAAKNGIDWQQDGALGGQRTSDAHGLNATSE